MFLHLLTKQDNLINYQIKISKSLTSKIYVTMTIIYRSGRKENIRLRIFGEICNSAWD